MMKTSHFRLKMQAIALSALVCGAAFAGAQTLENTHESSSAVASLVSSEGMEGGGASAAAHQSYRSEGWGNYLRTHFAGEVGAGFNAPTSLAGSGITWGGNVNVGGGLDFGHGFSVLAEYQFLDNKLPGKLIAETGADGGHAHIWGFTLNPTLDLMPKKATSVYVTAGGGFYRKVTSFTDPVLAEYCDYFYCEVGTTDAVVGHFSSNQGGWNAGAGITRRLGGRESRAKLFAEARYLYVDTPAYSNSPNGLGTVTVENGTSLIPVTFGLRW